MQDETDGRKDSLGKSRTEVAPGPDGRSRFYNLLVRRYRPQFMALNLRRLPAAAVNRRSPGRPFFATTPAR